MPARASPRICKKIEQRLSPDERARVGFRDGLVSTASAMCPPRSNPSQRDQGVWTSQRWVLLHGDEDQVRELAAVLERAVSPR
jgi:hypothetical protein